MTEVNVNVIHESDDPSDVRPGDWIVWSGKVYVRTDKDDLLFVDVASGEIAMLTPATAVRRLKRVHITAE